MAATAANAHPYMTVADHDTIVFTGLAAATIVGQIARPPASSTDTMTIARYQPTGSGGYRPTGASGYRPTGAGGYHPTGR